MNSPLTVNSAKANTETLSYDLFNPARSRTTYEKFSSRAEAGDPDAQNVIGYMLFYGEGVEQDHDRAHDWFHRAAEQGHVQAQRNLGFLHSQTIAGVPARFNDFEEANFWLGLASTGTPGKTDPAATTEKIHGVLTPLKEILDSTTKGSDRGERIFMRLCAGCHGFNGIAAYPAAPSFAFGERLTKNDTELLQSIQAGKNLMPSWGNTLDEELAREVLLFIRTQFESLASSKPENMPNIVLGPVEPTDGEVLFLAFCSGCHGRNGISYYVNSPSFALGETLEKSDGMLTHSILQGVETMAGWEEILSVQYVREIVSFIRTLEPSFKNGIASELRGEPELYFRFRPLGERGREWDGADPMAK